MTARRTRSALFAAGVLIVTACGREAPPPQSHPSGASSFLLERGIHVITPNKIANTGDLSTYRTLRGSERATPPAAD